MAKQQYDGAKVTIAIFLADTLSPHPIPALQLQLANKIENGLTAFSRQLNVARLARGAYRLEVILADRDGAILVRQSRSLVLR